MAIQNEFYLNSRIEAAQSSAITQAEAINPELEINSQSIEAANGAWRIGAGGDAEFKSGSQEPL